MVTFAMNELRRNMWKRWKIIISILIIILYLLTIGFFIDLETLNLGTLTPILTIVSFVFLLVLLMIFLFFKTRHYQAYSRYFISGLKILAIILIIVLLISPFLAVKEIYNPSLMEYLFGFIGILDLYFTFLLLNLIPKGITSMEDLLDSIIEILSIYSKDEEIKLLIPSLNIGQREFTYGKHLVFLNALHKAIDGGAKIEISLPKYEWETEFRIFEPFELKHENDKIIIEVRAPSRDAETQIQNRVQNILTDIDSGSNLFKFLKKFASPLKDISDDRYLEYFILAARNCFKPIEERKGKVNIELLSKFDPILNDPPMLIGFSNHMGFYGYYEYTAGATELLIRGNAIHDKTSLDSIAKLYKTLKITYK